ncbi:MAG: YeeE/YedE family protein [Bacteroidales bacterium]|nr:YeeE/YedE family protein [Bacteroidales bacterium]
MFPLTGTAALTLAVVFGFAFGWLLDRGRVTRYDTIINQFRFRDFTVLKVMLTAIIVGGVGVLALVDLGFAKMAVRDANMGGVLVGSALFGVGMVLYGYCPGTGVAAIATGSVHALVGAAGMLVGGMLYGFNYPWLKDTVLAWWNLGRVTLPDITGVPALVFFAALAALAVALFSAVESRRL